MVNSQVTSYLTHQQHIAVYHFPYLITLHFSLRFQDTLFTQFSSTFIAILFQSPLLTPLHFIGLKTPACSKTDSLNLFCFLFIFKPCMKSASLITLNAFCNLMGHIYILIVWPIPKFLTQVSSYRYMTYTLMSNKYLKLMSQTEFLIFLSFLPQSFSYLLMAIPSFQFLRSKALESILTTVSLSHSNPNLLAYSVGLTFIIYSDSDHFSPFYTITTWFEQASIHFSPELLY